MGAVRALEGSLGRPARLIGTLEELQVPLAVARERLGIAGLTPDAAANFRDKARMKDPAVLRQKAKIELVPDGEGTLLRFTHRDLPSAEAADSHGHGWDHYLERLEVAAAGGDPGPDPWLSGQMK